MIKIYLLYAQKKNINIFTPASLVNLINEARHQLLLENSLYDFQYLAEFIEQISSENSDNTDINDDEIGSENNENNTAEFTANKQIDSFALDLENQTAQDENYKADITNIADEIAKQQQINNLKPDSNLADEASADAYANTGDNINTDKLNISNLSDDTNKGEQSSANEPNAELDAVADIAENEIDDKELETNEKLVSDSDMHVDKLNIGNFLDGANEEELSSATEPNAEVDAVTDIAENEIDDKELKTNETLASDSDMHVDKLNIGNFLDGANEEELSSATEPNAELDEVTDIAENEIDDKELETNETLASDSDMHVDKLNIGNFLDGANEEEQSSTTEPNAELDEVTDIAENEIDDKELETNETLASDSDMHVDKLNIGNFLDGANEEELSSATEPNAELDEVTDIAENEIDDKELETNETLASDSDMHVDKLNIGNFLDGANEEEQSSATEPDAELDDMKDMAENEAENIADPEEETDQEEDSSDNQKDNKRLIMMILI